MSKIAFSALSSFGSVWFAMCAAVPTPPAVLTTFSQEYQVKKILVIAVVALSFSVVGCVGWAHFGSHDRSWHNQKIEKPNRHYDKHSFQH
jgi:hypothetical protein